MKRFLFRRRRRHKTVRIRFYITASCIHSACRLSINRDAILGFAIETTAVVLTTHRLISVGIVLLIMCVCAPNCGNKHPRPLIDTNSNDNCPDILFSYNLFASTKTTRRTTQRHLAVALVNQSNTPHDTSDHDPLFVGW